MGLLIVTEGPSACFPGLLFLESSSPYTGSLGKRLPTASAPRMITGYNTDVRHGEVVFHVQTEDKGTSNPLIESLVYVGGQVLASKRASYAEMLAEGKEEKEIVALMDHQHRTMIAAIRHGKLDAKLAALNVGKQTGQFASFETPAPTRPATGAAPLPPMPVPVAPLPVMPAPPAPPRRPDHLWRAAKQLGGLATAPAA